MQKLYKKLEKYNLKDAINFEEKDRQFLALKDLWEKIWSSENEKNNFYLSLIIANSIVCYQLSGKWENYWEEFSLYVSEEKNTWSDVIKFLTKFLKTCKNNKRFTETKIQRLEKLRPFLEEFYGKEKYFYENMLELRDMLAKTMKQKKDAKTIVFAVKMFSYGARNVFDFEYFPKEIAIPIDSRLTNLFEKYNSDYENIAKFYFDLAEKLDIPELHLDWIIWNLYDELI